MRDEYARKSSYHEKVIMDFFDSLALSLSLVRFSFMASPEVEILFNRMHMYEDRMFVKLFLFVKGGLIILQQKSSLLYILTNKNKQTE